MHRLGVIGYGGMGEHHTRKIKALLDGVIETVGIFDIRPERQEAARKNGLVVYSSAEELLADESIDVVLVSTSNDVHKKYGIMALEAGKNVILEKPATMCAADFEEITAVSKRTGKVLTVHQNRRWDKDFNIVKRIYEEKPLGDVYAVESRVQSSRQFLHGWRGEKINGGGMVYDWGVHLLDQLMFMDKSPVCEVYAHLFNIYTDEVDDNFKTLIKFEDGLSALIEVSMNCFILHPRWHVSAVNGTAVINDWACNGKMVKLDDDAELEWSEKIVYTEAGPTRSMAPRPPETTKEIPLPEVSCDWAEFYKGLCDHIDGKCDLPVKPDSVLRVLKVIDAIFESSAKGQSIKCRI